MSVCTLRSIPDDLYKEILKEQEVIKKRKEVKIYSVEMTILHMLKELLAIRKEIKK